MSQSSQIDEDVRWKGCQVVSSKVPRVRGGTRGGRRAKMQPDQQSQILVMLSSVTANERGLVVRRTSMFRVYFASSSFNIYMHK